MSFNFVPSSTKEKMDTLSFTEEEKKVLSRSFCFFSSDFAGRRTLEETTNFLLEKLLHEKKEKTYTIIDSNPQFSGKDMEIEFAGPPQQPKNNIKEGWNVPSKRKTFRNSSAKKKPAPQEQKKRKENNKSG